MNRFNLWKSFLPTSTLIPWTKQANLVQSKIVKANGPYIYTSTQKIVDFTSGAMVVNLGHNNKYILDSIKEHTKSGISYIPSNMATYQRDKLSDRLLSISKMNVGKVLYGNAGADVNEMACFLSKEYYSYQDKPKNKILTFSHSFHGGSTVGASLLSGDARRVEKEKYYSLPMEPIMENPLMSDSGESSLQQISDLLTEDVSAVLIEGSSGSAGCILYPDGYLKKLETMCREKDILVICDEVMSGFGRTGEFFAHFKQDIQPDIITCAKGITSGYSQLGAVIINKKVSDVFEYNPVMCGLTYSGHILGSTIANSCLDLYLKNDMAIIKNHKGNVLSLEGERIKNKYDWIKDYRNNGMLGCFEFSLNEDKLGELSENLMLEGIYCMRIRQNIFTAPPLITDDSIIVDTMQRMDRVFEKMDLNFIF
jgi:taurine---2-oxoglutarate transaminase